MDELEHARPWHLAPSLVVLRGELDRRFPTRSVRSDGSIGDARHKLLKSDHNPDMRGVVHALDITNDPRVCPAAALVNYLVKEARARRERRIEYIIYDGHIWSRRSLFSRRAYTGSNPHTSHFHISIKHTLFAETSVRWWLSSFDRRK